MNLIHTCYRITDIDRSVAFYQRPRLPGDRAHPDREEAVNVFMGIPGDGDMPRLELTYNFGVDHYKIGTGYGTSRSHRTTSTEPRAPGAQGIAPEKPPYRSARAARGCAS